MRFPLKRIVIGISVCIIVTLYGALYSLEEGQQAIPGDKQSRSTPF
jgi:hypothetical protein